MNAREALAALYLPGGKRPFEVCPSHWLRVASLLAAHAPIEWPAALERRGLWAEARLIREPGPATWARGELAAGRVLTSFCQAYPPRWRDRLGSGAPAALWGRGEIPLGPFVAVVGSRDLCARDRRFAFDVGRQVAALGYTLVSGGARGADSWAAVGAASAGGRVLVLLPCGLGSPMAAQVPTGALLSAQPCSAGFTPAAAHARNTLIHGCAEATIVVRSRLRQGGTWEGTSEALRRRFTRVLVNVEGRPDAAAKALMALGGLPLSSPSDLATALAGPGPAFGTWPQPTLLSVPVEAVSSMA